MKEKQMSVSPWEVLHLIMCSQAVKVASQKQKRGKQTQNQVVIWHHNDLRCRDLCEEQGLVTHPALPSDPIPALAIGNPIGFYATGL